MVEEDPNDREKQHTQSAPSAPGKRFDPEKRREELIEHFQVLGSDKARRQITLLPYYHAVENAITKPNQGTFVTRYFRTKWRPSLGNEASEIVLALRFLADSKSGETFASHETIAKTAGLSIRCVERWLSHVPPKNRSEKWLGRWRFLHTYFILGKRKKYEPVKVGNRIEYRRRTNRLKMAMDDPVHPDDEGKLYAEAAQRIANEEYKSAKTDDRSRNRPADGYGDVPYEIEVDKSPRNRPADGYPAPTSGRSLSVPYRSNVFNVKGNQSVTEHTDQNFASDPRVQNLTQEEREHREKLVAEMSSMLYEKDPGSIDPETGRHKDEGYLRRAAYFMPEQLLRKAMMDFREYLDAGRTDQRETKHIRKTPSAVFGGFIKRIAKQKEIDLGINWTEKN